MKARIERTKTRTVASRNTRVTIGLRATARLPRRIGILSTTRRIEAGTRTEVSLQEQDQD